MDHQISLLKKKKKEEKKSHVVALKVICMNFPPLSVTFALLFPPLLKGQRPSKLNEIMSRATRALTSPFLSFFLFRFWQLLANTCMQPVWFAILVHLSLLRHLELSSWCCSLFYMYLWQVLSLHFRNSSALDWTGLKWKLFWTYCKIKSVYTKKCRYSH